MKQRYTKEEINRANEYSLVELLKRSGYILIPERRGEYHLQEHDSLKISEEKNRWKWFSRDLGGKNIDFFMQYENLDFLSAVDKIFSLTNDVSHNAAKEVKHASGSVNPDKRRTDETLASAEFALPEKNKDNRRAFAYLTEKRCLDKKLIQKLINSGYIYESKDHHNVIFVGTDYEGNIKSSFERGTGIQKFARDTSGSSKDYRFRINSPSSDKVNVFEAEIDMLSFISLTGIKDENYVALGGTSPLALDSFMKEQGENIKVINLCLDNDAAGKSAAKKIAEKFNQSDIQINIYTPKLKDWNEDLVALQDYAVQEECNKNMDSECF